MMDRKEIIILYIAILLNHDPFFSYLISHFSLFSPSFFLFTYQIPFSFLPAQKMASKGMRKKKEFMQILTFGIFSPFTRVQFILNQFSPLYKKYIAFFIL